MVRYVCHEDTACRTYTWIQFTRLDFLRDCLCHTKILEEPSQFKQRQMKCHVRHLTETRARLHLLTLERKPDRGAAVRMYQAINPAWPSANSLCNRLSKIASALWLGYQQADSRVTAATRGLPPPMQVNETLVEPILAAMREMVGTRVRAHTSALVELQVIQYKSTQRLMWLVGV